MLIGVDTLGQYADITELALENTVMERHIKDAQNIDLKEFLGSPLYFDMLANRSDEKYVNLIRGENYECTYNGTTYTVEYKGLQDVLSYWALARIVKFHGAKITAQGISEDLYEHSESISRRNRMDMSNSFKSLADEYQKDVVDYLENNSSTYPLYTVAKPINTTFKAHAITGKKKDDYNSNIRFL